MVQIRILDDPIKMPFNLFRELNSRFKSKS